MLKTAPIRIRRPRHLPLAFALAALALAIFAPGALASYAYTANYSDGTVSVVNTQTNQVVGAPISVGPGAYGVAIAPDGKTAYALSEGDESVSAIDTQSKQAIGSAIPLGTQPGAIAIAPDGKTAYVTSQGTDGVVAVNLQTNQVVGAPIPVAPESYGIAITPDGKTAYVTSSSEGTVSVIDTQTNQVVGAPITVGESPVGIAITPDGKRVYVVNEDEGTVSVIDTQTNQVVGAPITVGESPFDLAIAPDGKTAYVANTDEGTVSVIDTLANQVVGAPIPVGEEPYAVAFTPDGNDAYVPDYSSEDVSTIDTHTRQVIGTPIPVAGGPWRIAMTPDQGPQASFAAGTARVGTPLAFNGAASSDPDGSIARYEWSFGDGLTATSTVPTLTHTYGAPGTYLATLTVTDNEGCSTSFVFTGQTASCNGSSVATTARAVIVSALPSNRFRFGKIKRNRRNGTARLQIKVPGPGVLVLRGKKVRYAKHKATKAGSTFLTVRPKIKLNRALKRRHHAKVKVRVSFTPTGGKTSTKSKALKLIRR